MTTTYDPSHPSYLVELDLRQELTRVYDLCQGCRLCLHLCPAFPTMFNFIDNDHNGDAAELSHAEQDQVVDECYQCKLCYLKCPYIPPHEWELDFPRLMMRAQAVRQDSGAKPLSDRVTDQFLGRTDLIGKLSTLTAPVVNAVISKPGSLARRVMQTSVGIHEQRMLPPYARQRFTTWFKKRRRDELSSARAEVAVFPTCFVEYMEPGIAKDLVRVYEHNSIACSLPEGTSCCGAPWLHNGDIRHFQRVAKKNVDALAKAVRAGREIIIAQPTCAYIIKRDYPIYCPGEDTEMVAEHSFDAAEYLMAEHRREGAGLDLEFKGERPELIAYHQACHLRAQNMGLKGRDLLALTGARVSLVERCSGIDGTWGYRAENYELSKKVAVPLARELSASGADMFCGDCHLANTAILEETGRRPLHPLQILARAYGFSEAEE